jgi:hypothetical protein
MIDLDKRREEAGIEPRTMRFAGRDWPLPATLPMAVLAPLGQLVGKSAEELDVTAVAAACRALLGEQADDILAAGFGFQEFAWLLEEYGMSVGEAPASSQS